LFGALVDASKRADFMALQTDRLILIDWSVGAGSAFLRRPPPIC
jgi:hypothetical protein